MIKSLKILLVTAMLAFVTLSAPAQEAQTIDEVLVILTSPSLQTQGMAMVLSNTMARQGAKVNVLLCDQAGDLALKQHAAPALKPNDVTPAQLLRGLLNQGATANVCALYLPNSIYGAEDLIDGVGVATPPEMASQMLDPNIRTFSF